MNNKIDIKISKYFIKNFDELIKDTKYKFKEPYINDSGIINMYWELEEIINNDN